jgi:hypothetical protein
METDMKEDPDAYKGNLQLKGNPGDFGGAALCLIATEEKRGADGFSVNKKSKQLIIR